MNSDKTVEKENQTFPNVKIDDTNNQKEFAEENIKFEKIIKKLINSIYSLESNMLYSNILKRKIDENIEIILEDNKKKINENNNNINQNYDIKTKLNKNNDNSYINKLIDKFEITQNNQNFNGENNIIEEFKSEEENKIKKYDIYISLIEKIKNCKSCTLYQNRNKVVPGAGNLLTNIMFIGEGPGEQEDIQGLPFVGKAGKLLDNALYSVGFDREKIYITNVVKCRPPNNRNPEKNEILACYKYLIQQIELISPKIIVSLGKISANTLLRTNKNITEIRGKFIKLEYLTQLQTIPIFFATYHPSAILRNQNLYNDFLNDLKKLYSFAKKYKMY
ncbi:MAG: uracil-DNA glycosylase [Candidatus Goldbacteria bacterium]|nr:uracil-DNA glycosylase [Candidatus Goldiibacteriota bacterium]